MSVPASERCTATTDAGRRCGRRRTGELRVCAQHAEQWETDVVASIAAAAETDWRAGAWLLERRFPERWGKTSPRPADDFLAPAVQAPEPEAEPAPADPFAALDELTAARERRAG